MQRLTVETTAHLDGQPLGKGFLALEERKCSWTGAGSASVLVKYSDIWKYGICYEEEPPYNCLYTGYRSIVDGESVQKCIRCWFETENDLTAVMAVLLENVDLDPCHISSNLWKETISSKSDSRVNQIDELILKTHVTCLKFVGSLLLAGVGGNLHIFMKSVSKHSWICTLTRQIFQGQNIHGIRVSSTNDLVLFGGKKLCFLRLFTSNMCKVRLLYLYEATDWILDCSWLGDDRHIALLTANNALAYYHLSFCKPTLISWSHCVERCILYSGTILGDSWDDVTVLAGTVFSTIVIWSNSGVGQTKGILQRLEGHKGVIFSVTYCDKIRRISSTSDDRTVRVWDVEFEDLHDWQRCKISLKFSLYGHSARVWRSCLLGDGKIVSVGEDSRICLWYSCGKLQNQYCGHQDGEIWSLDVLEEMQLIATGGSDGGITLWPMSEEQVPYGLNCSEQIKSKPKCVGILGGGRPFMVNWSGDVFLHQDSSWKLCFSEPELSSYCLHAISSNREMLALASITGRIIICRSSHDHLRKIIDLNVCEGRIFSVKWLSNSSIIVCESEGIFSLWELVPASVLMEKKFDFVLPISKERWVTSCAADDTHLVCGDRCGSLYLFCKQDNLKNPVDSAKKIHGHNGVTDVKYLNGKFVSTGRDGKYREFLIVHNKLVMLQCYKLKLDWAAAVCETSLFGTVIFCFHEVFFVIWSLKERRPIVRIDCGGGHRSWDCTVDSEQYSIFISYIKGKSVNYCCIPIENVLSHTLLPGSHPKAINSADIVPVLQDNLMDSRLILLGGEDTTLRLVTVNDTLSGLCILQNHLSSVRAIKCYRSAYNNTVYVASGGGRGQLILWKVYQQEAALDVVELNSYSVMSQENAEAVNDVAEMRIMDVQLYQRSSELVTIAAGCSDGTLRVFHFCTESNIISEAQIFYYDCCLLKVCVIDHLRASVLIAASTSGILFFQTIKASGLLEGNEHSFSASCTGINSCDYEIFEDSLILSCAGDDALVNIFLLSHSPSDKCFEVSSKWTHDEAHSCQISGLRLVDSFVFTVGLDQILSIFSWAVLKNRITANLLTRVELSIPDIHGVLVWPCSEEKSYRIFLHGLGAQLLTFFAINGRVQ